MSDDPIRQARRWFAEELRFVTRVGVRDLIEIRRANASDVIEAFATVPRERFVGPGPLRVLSPWDMKRYWTPADQSPAAVYHDALIAYDEKRYLNNGQPSLWAFVLDKVEVARGERVLHLGCGMGYYTAILAELVGLAGEVLASRSTSRSPRRRAKRSPHGLRSRSRMATARREVSGPSTSSWRAPAPRIRFPCGSKASRRADASSSR
jgi:hypothetical protein